MLRYLMLGGGHEHIVQLDLAGGSLGVKILAGGAEALDVVGSQFDGSLPDVYANRQPALAHLHPHQRRLMVLTAESGFAPKSRTKWWTKSCLRAHSCCKVNKDCAKV